jgi:hypothetical protein
MSWDCALCKENQRAKRVRGEARDKSKTNADYWTEVFPD